MIPARFVVEYPQRCLDLIEALEPTARQRELVGSFSLLVAAAVFVIPYERMGSQRHPLHKAARDVDLFRALKTLRKKPLNSPKETLHHGPILERGAAERLALLAHHDQCKQHCGVGGRGGASSHETACKELDAGSQSR